MRQALTYTLTLAAAVGLMLCGVHFAHAEEVDGPWENIVGQPADPNLVGPIWDANTNHPIVGDDVELPDDNSNFAEGEMVFSPFSLMTLTNPGDKIVFTGNVDLDGTINSPLTSGTPRTQYRFGLFKSNTDANDLGWVGYYMSNKHGNAGTPSGVLGVKPVVQSPSPTTPLAVGGQVVLGSAQGEGTAASLFNDGNYAMNLTIERNSLGELLVSSSLTGTNEGNVYSHALSGTHTVAATDGTYSFDSLVFLLGGNLDADRAAFSDLDVTFIPAGSEGLDGDFDNNGVVDAADYVAWRKGMAIANDNDPPGAGPEDYDAWVANFGATSPGSGGGGAVPEPAAVVLLAIGCLLAVCRRKRISNN